MPNNRERTIDALARNNSIIKSLFHFEKKITFLIVSLAIQKIKTFNINEYKVHLKQSIAKSKTVFLLGVFSSLTMYFLLWITLSPLISILYFSPFTHFILVNSPVE
jgi:hypothetical protein